MKRLVFILALFCGAVAARADEDAAARAWQRLDGAKLSAADASARIHELSVALEQAGLGKTATVAISALAADERQDAAVRAAARDELIARAAQDPSVAQSLLARQDHEGKLPGAVALRMAKAHLERALQLSPLEEGVAFEGVAQGPSLKDASVQEKPLDPELAAEMGAPEHEQLPKGQAPQATEPAQGAAAKLELDRARALAASVPQGDALEADAHEIAGLAALAGGDLDGAEKEFVAVVSIPVRRGDEPAIERRDKAYLQLARLAYQRGDDGRATQLYDRVGRGAPEWLDALFEASWAHFRKGHDERALGNLLTLHAPFFQGRFFPESFVLKALVLYENCRYPEARAALAEFQQRYQPLHDGLAGVVDKLPTAQRAYEFLAAGATQIEANVPPTAREEVARIEQEPAFLESVKAVSQLAQEIDSIDHRPAHFRASPFAAKVIPLVREARMQLLEATGQKLFARLSSERAELRELLGQSLRLSYEIAGREKDLASAPDNGLVATPHGEPPQVDEDEVLWPFQGEYWRDELGSYRFQLGQRCKKQREAPMRAQQPAALPQEPHADAKP